MGIKIGKSSAYKCSLFKAKGLDEVLQEARYIEQRRDPKRKPWDTSIAACWAKKKRTKERP